MVRLLCGRLIRNTDVLGSPSARDPGDIWRPKQAESEANSCLAVGRVPFVTRGMLYDVACMSFSVGTKIISEYILGI